MSLIKSRNWTKKEDDDLLVVLDELKAKQREATWNQIAQLIKQRNPSSRKTGKQCRQRWANQLDPKIKRSQNWTAEQNQTLFKLHLKLGNKWSEICSNIPGRTDNCVKNHFYSTMRRGMRKVNTYIENVKRKTILAKTFKNQILNKILTICEGKNDEKFQFNQTAKELALSIKSRLVKISLQLSDADQQNIEFKQLAFNQILQFSRNCRKRKTKKSCQVSSISDADVNSRQKQKNGPEQPEQMKQKERVLQQELIKQKLMLTPSKKQLSAIKDRNNQQPKIEIPIILQRSLFQAHNSVGQVVFPKICQVSIIKQPEIRVDSSNKLNQFPFICPNQEQIFSLFNINQSFPIQKGSGENKNDLKSSIFKPEPQDAQKKQQGILNRIPQIVKGSRDQRSRKNQSGVFDFSNLSNISQIQQKAINNFSTLIKSQDLSNSYEIQQNLSFLPMFSKQNTSNQIMESNMGISYSPLYSPFSMFSNKAFNFYGNWPMQEDKMSSTGFLSRNYEEESDRQKQKQGKKQVRSQFQIEQARRSVVENPETGKKSNL